MLHEDALLVKCKAAGLVAKYFRGRGEAAEFLLIHIIYNLEDAVLARKSLENGRWRRFSKFDDIPIKILFIRC